MLDFYHPARTCVGCGSCANACPTGAIQVKDVGDTRTVSLAGTLLKEHKLERCSRCGQPYAPLAYLDHLAGRLDKLSAPTSRVEERICPACARPSQAREKWAARFAVPGGESRSPAV